MGGGVGDGAEAIVSKKKPASQDDFPLRLEWRTPAELNDNPANWRTHPEEQTKSLAAVVKQVGWAGAALFNERTQRLVDGHARKKIKPELLVNGKMPVLVGNWTEEQERMILATLDPIAAMAEANEDTLSALLATVQTNDADIGRMLANLAEETDATMPEWLEAYVPQELPAIVEDDPPEPPADPVTRPGDMWTLGEHRLYVSPLEVVLPTLADASVDMVFTDPPYGHNNNNGDLIQRWEAALGRPQTKSSAPRPIANDGAEDAAAIFAEFVKQAARLLKPGCCCCCCCGGGGGPDPQFARWTMQLDEAIGFKQAVVWDKGGLGMGWHYRRNYEFVLVAEKPGAACKWYGGHNVANVVRDIGKIIPSEDQHPTEKPVALPALFLGFHSQEGDVVLEPFCGSGSTLSACEQMGRTCIATEIDPVFADMTIRRWCKLTGRDAVRQDGKTWSELQPTEQQT